MNAQNIGKCIISAIGLISTFYSLVNLMIFLSDPYKIQSINAPRRGKYFL